MSRPILLAAATLAVSGCTSITGLGGGSGYSCKAPEGVACDSMSGVYANTVADGLPGRRTAAAPPVLPASPSRVAPTAPVGTSPATASSLRSSARVLRLWIKPWEDADGDLFDQSFVYVQVDNGKWLIDHAQRQIREAYAPVKPPPRLLTSGSAPESAIGPQRSAQTPATAAATPRRPATPDAED